MRRGVEGCSVPVALLDGRVRAGAEQRGRRGGVALVGSPVQRRGPAGIDGNGGGTGPPRAHQAAAPPSTHLVRLSWMFSDAPALMSTRTDGRWPWYAAWCKAVSPPL